MMITVNHLNHSRSRRAMWFLEELGLPHEMIRHKRDPHTSRSPAALK
jgi:glutathione S-transferase